MNRVNDHVYRGVPFQRGYGLGGTFKKFFNWAIPLIQKHAGPVIKQGITTVGKRAIDTVADIARDVVDGKNLKTSVKERLHVTRYMEKV